MLWARRIFFAMATMISYALSKIPGWVTSAIFTFCFGYCAVINAIAGKNAEALHISAFFVMGCFETFYLYSLKKNTNNH